MTPFFTLHHGIDQLSEATLGDIPLAINDELAANIYEKKYCSVWDSSPKRFDSSGTETRLKYGREMLQNVPRSEKQKTKFTATGAAQVEGIDNGQSTLVCLRYTSHSEMSYP